MPSLASRPSPPLAADVVDRRDRRLGLAGACLLALALAATPRTAAQPPASAPDLLQSLDLGFERGAEGWFLRDAAADREVAHDGAQSVRLEHGGAGGFAVASRTLPIERARGQRVRLGGWMRTADVESGYAGLWLRVDRGQEMLFLDNMSDRGLTGTHEWTAVEIEAEVPADATAVVLGAILTGRGKAWVDDLAVGLLPPMAAGEKVSLSGRVVAPDGSGVAGATVAAVPLTSMVPVAVAASGADGAFSLSVPPGRYALTATHPDLAPAFVATVAAQEDAEVPVPLAAADEGFALAGEVRDSSGASMGGAEVRCYRESDVEGDVFVTHADPSGRYATRLLHATHGCSASLDGLHSAITEVADGTARLDLSIWRPSPPPVEVVSWIRTQAVPLLTPRAGHGFEDMRGLASLIGDAQVVALGEATHGSREIFQMKHRMLEYLVAEHGFTVFAIEANWPESEAVNDYVTRGEGDPAAALSGLYFWTWNTEEVLDLIRWMREWNAVPGHPQVKFYGFDMQTGRVAAGRLGELLQRTAPALATELAPGLAVAASEAGATPAAEELARLGAALERADRRLAAASPSGIASRDWLLGRQYVRVLRQWVERQQAGNRPEGFAVRDRAMAENLRWIAEVAEPGARIVAWAHNGHVGDAGTFVPWMGRHLEAALGGGYLPIGFLFHHGGFQAIDRTGARQGLHEFTLGAPPAGTLEDAFERAGWPLCALDLRALPAGPVADWFGREQRMRETGAVFSSEENMTVTRVLSQDFEVVIFVESTTRARPNPGGLR